MRLHNHYTPFLDHWEKTKSLRAALENSSVPHLQNSAQEIHPALEEHARQTWLTKAETAQAYLDALPETLARIHDAAPELKTLPGEIHLVPSLGHTDGFARYDRGAHTVYLGIDHPDADLAYLQALTAHELSHVIRDHRPATWAHLGKPLQHITRREYLDAATNEEHLVSEGLATLFSQHVFPEIDARTHHFYDPIEWAWITANLDEIDRALIEELNAHDPDVWSFYGEGRVSPGSPGREQYYWAALKIDRAHQVRTRRDTLLELHGAPASEFRPIFVNPGL
jgi:HPt (histidine-containing phosphotransfer) domain-containing protein